MQSDAETGSWDLCAGCRSRARGPAYAPGRAMLAALVNIVESAGSLPQGELAHPRAFVASQCLDYAPAPVRWVWLCLWRMVVAVRTLDAPGDSLMKMESRWSGG